MVANPATASPASSLSGASPPSVSSSSVVSSDTESDGEIGERRAGAYASLARVEVDICDGPNPPPAYASPLLSDGAAPPAEAIVVKPSAKKYRQWSPSEKRKNKRKKGQQFHSASAGESIFDLGKDDFHSPAMPVQGAAAAVAAPLGKNPKQRSVDAPPNSQKQSSTEAYASSPPNNVSNFRNLQLPTASFSLPDSAVATKTDSKELLSIPHPLPLPTATAAHLKWKDAVIATRRHADYSHAFNYESAQRAELVAGISHPSDWITTRPYGPWCKSNPASIAIDCEMCQTAVPGSGSVNEKALCRMSVVNAEDPSEVLLDTLVKPEWPVSNYRTWVNGIKASDLENVQFTLKHAQKFMSALCSEQTLVVGHAVHNDLLALRMVHHCNVDTALLYRYAGEDQGTPSLKNLAQGVFKREMPDVHDSVNDARVALVCAQHYIDQNGEVEPVEKVFTRSCSSGNFGKGNSSRGNSRPDNSCRDDPGKGNSRRFDSSDTTMLLVHRLPSGTQPEHISEMFLAFTSVKIQNVPEITFSGSQGKCHVQFRSREHAELAYTTLAGEEREDKRGKKQKRLGLRDGGYVYVRKMNRDN